MTNAVVQLTTEGTLPSFSGATEWLNSPPLSSKDLRGKVVVVNFWTYTCINWIRTLPHIRAWSEKYRDKGLVSIGVHTPEFSFEHDISNVRQALRHMGIVYPIVVDNNYDVWGAFNNHYWPSLYFIDTKGGIRHHQYGEGEYGTSEQVIQQLLAERGVEKVRSRLVITHPKDVELAADWKSLESPETYLGYERATDFASPGGMKVDDRAIYEDPYELPLNHWSLSGDWTVGAQAVISNFEDGRISYRFHARDLNLVMGPITRGAPISFRVQIDQHPPGKAHGVDVDEKGRGSAREQRLYQLVRQPNHITDHQFEIEFQSPGIEAFAFTFG